MRSPVRQQNRTIKALEWLKVMSFCGFCILPRPPRWLLQRGSEKWWPCIWGISTESAEKEGERSVSPSSARRMEVCIGGFTYFDRCKQAVENTHSQSKRLGGKLECAARFTQPHDHLVVLSWADIWTLEANAHNRFWHLQSDCIDLKKKNFFLLLNYKFIMCFGGYVVLFSPFF